MSKYQFTREGTWVYPSIDVTATFGDVIESDYAIDAWWEQVDDTTPATIPPPSPNVPSYSETPDGAFLIYDKAANKGVWSQVAPFDDQGRLNEAGVPQRLTESALDLRYLLKSDVTTREYERANDDSLAYNSDFELWDDANGVPVGWWFDNHAAATKETANPISGLVSVRLTPTDADFSCVLAGASAGNTASLPYQIPVSAGDTVTISALMQEVGNLPGGGKLALWCYNAAGYVTNVTLAIDLHPGSTPTRMSASGVVPAGVTFVAPMVMALNAAGTTGSLIVDSIKVTKGAVASVPDNLQSQLDGLSANQSALMASSASVEELVCSTTLAGAVIGSSFVVSTSAAHQAHIWAAPFSCKILSLTLINERATTPDDPTNYLSVSLNKRPADGGTTLNIVKKYTNTANGGEAWLQRVAWTYDMLTWDENARLLDVDDLLYLSLDAINSSAPVVYPITVVLRYQPL